MNAPLLVGRELPDADAIIARLDYLDEERKLLTKILHATILLEGRRPFSPKNSIPQPDGVQPEVVNVAR